MNTSKEPENLYEEPPVPEIKPCPICGKTPSVYCAGCSMLGSGASTGFWNCRCIDCDYPKRPSGLSVNYCNKADAADHWNELADRSEKTLDAPLPECPICNKRPTLVEIVGKGMVYDCGCDFKPLPQPDRSQERLAERSRPQSGLPEKASLLHGCAVKKLTSLAAVGRFLSTYRLQANKYHTAICCGNHRPEPFGVSGHAPSSPRHRTRHTSLTVGQHCNTVTARTFSVRIRARPRGKDMS